MPRVFIPPLLRPLTQGVAEVEIAGSTVRQIVTALDQQFPGIGPRLLVEGQLRPGMAVAVNGTVATKGLLQQVPAGAEVHFLPAIGGG
jgi:sulfur-carrier protein